MKIKREKLFLEYYWATAVNYRLPTKNVYQIPPMDLYSSADWEHRSQPPVKVMVLAAKSQKQTLWSN